VLSFTLANSGQRSAVSGQLFITFSEGYFALSISKDNKKL
jgi:hypothetical protein